MRRVYVPNQMGSDPCWLGNQSGSDPQWLGDARGVAVDINWLYASDLRRILAERGAFSWFMFATGRIAHDPGGLAAEGQELCRAWFAWHPEVRDAWETQQERVRLAKADPSVTLEYPTQPEFVAYLVSAFGDRDDG